MLDTKHQVFMNIVLKSKQTANNLESIFNVLLCDNNNTSIQHSSKLILNTFHICVTVSTVSGGRKSGKVSGSFSSTFFLSVPIRLVQSYLSVLLPFSSGFCQMLKETPHFLIAEHSLC